MEAMGYVKLYRKILENPVVCKDAEYFAIWIYLLLSATHKPYETLFNGTKIILKSGQLITGRKVISKKLTISEGKVTRVLEKLKIEQQIEQQTSNKNRLITILNWEEYQSSEQQIEHQLNNNWTTTEQQLNTNKNTKNIKNTKNTKNIHNKIPFDYQQLYDFYRSLNLIQHKELTPKMKEAIDKARTSCNYNLDDMKTLLEKHKATVDRTAGMEYEVKARPLWEFFGQKAYQATHLICQDYEIGGKYDKTNDHELHFKKSTGGIQL